MQKFIICFMLMVLVLIAHDVSAGSFNDLDISRDGKLDRKELGAAATVVFKKYDKNGDGYLDKSEFQSIKKTSSRFADLDTNHDGKLDMKELHNAASAKYDRYDKDADGALSDMECNPSRKLNIDPLFRIYF